MRRKDKNGKNENMGILVLIVVVIVATVVFYFFWTSRPTAGNIMENIAKQEHPGNYVR